MAYTLRGPMARRSNNHSQNAASIRVVTTRALIERVRESPTTALSVSESHDTVWSGHHRQIRSQTLCRSMRSSRAKCTPSILESKICECVPCLNAATNGGVHAACLNLGAQATNESFAEVITPPRLPQPPLLSHHRIE